MMTCWELRAWRWLECHAGKGEQASLAKRKPRHRRKHASWVLELALMLTLALLLPRPRKRK